MLDFDPDSIEVLPGHFINGRRTATGDDTLDVRRPSDGRVYASLPLATPDIVDEAVAAAQNALRTSAWARCAPRERAAILRRWADLMVAHAEELGRLEALGSTRPVAEATGGDVRYAADCIRFFAEYADKMGGEVAATRSDHLGMMITEPYGVVGAIAPWNYPMNMAAWKVGPALAAGNAMVLKPSELTPFTAVRMAELAVAAGMPAGIFNVVQGTGPVVGEAICRHPGIGKISFTGSNRTGVAIMAMAAQSGLKPVTLELGGKSPQLVFADAPDLQRVAECIASSIIVNAGQTCVAGTRLIVERRAEAELLDRLCALMKQAKAGPTWQSATKLPPIISAQQGDRIDAMVRRSIESGAEALTGGRPMRCEGDGAYYEPTILTRVTADTEAVRDEIFGPVLTVQSFEDEDQGLAMADHPVYGLAAGVHTGSVKRALRAVREIKAGTVWVNRYGRTADHVIPTGGFKGSGIGKDLGRQAFEANLRVKSTLIDFSAAA
jgi:aldehyde dehydrogenase (NAD+)